MCFWDREQSWRQACFFTRPYMLGSRKDSGVPLGAAHIGFIWAFKVPLEGKC